MTRNNKPGSDEGVFLTTVFQIVCCIFVLGLVLAPFKELLDWLGPGFKSFLRYPIFAAQLFCAIMLFRGVLYPNDKPRDKK